MNKQLNFAFVIILGLFFSAIFYTVFLHPPKYSNGQKITVSSQNIAVPLTLTIKKLGITTSIESVGKDVSGNMDVPKNVSNVGWYKFGARPGEHGNAVIAGHLDSETGPAVFYNLSTLQPGDEVTLTDTVGHKFIYIVKTQAIYDDDKFPLQQVFGNQNKSMLNLITCRGVFNTITKNYSQRVVVYTQLKQI